MSEEPKMTCGSRKDGTNFRCQRELGHLGFHYMEREGIDEWGNEVTHLDVWATCEGLGRQDTLLYGGLYVGSHWLDRDEDY